MHQIVNADSYACTILHSVQLSPQIGLYQLYSNDSLSFFSHLSAAVQRIRTSRRAAVKAVPMQSAMNEDSSTNKGSWNALYGRSTQFRTPPALTTQVNTCPLTYIRHISYILRCGLHAFRWIKKKLTLVSTLLRFF